MSARARRPDPRIAQKAKLQERLRKKVAVKEGPKTICLTMIVKTAAELMPRLLNSLWDPHAKAYLIDFISIVDTYDDEETSPDGTTQVILDWGQEHNIPTSMHTKRFVSFGHNRTHSYRMATKSFPQASYLLLLDADHVIDWSKSHRPFDKTLLTDHKYLLNQFNTSMNYSNIRLISTKLEWESLCSTHEFTAECKKQPNFHGQSRTSKITTIAINDIEDSTCRYDPVRQEGKYERDIRLLSAELEDPATPDYLIPRIHFYLNNSKFDSFKFLEAIPGYEKRIALKGWAEEVYYSKYRIGLCHERLAWYRQKSVELMGKSEKSEEELAFIQKWNADGLDIVALALQVKAHFDAAAVSYMAAYKYRPCRAEALYALTKMYRERSMHQQAYDLLPLGRKIVYPKDDTLFIETGCYDYLWDFEESILGWYLPGKQELGAAATSRLLQRGDEIPQSIRNALEANAHHYL